MTSQKKKHTGYTTLVLGGGANRGIMYGGALQCLHDCGILRGIDTYIGSSVGALMCALLVVGYTTGEIATLIMSYNFSSAKPSRENEIYNIFTRYACYSTSQMEAVTKRVLAERAEIPELTLGQLYEVYCRTLVITTCCVNSGETVYLSHHTHPDLPIYKAVCMSMTIPFVFEPYLLDGLLYVDGGSFGHMYPIYWSRMKRGSMLGVRLAPCAYEPVKITSMMQYAKLIGYGAMSTERCKEHSDTITLTCDVSTFADEIASATKTKLINDAYASAFEWLSRFFFASLI